MNCPVCGSVQRTRFAAWPDFAVDECTACGFRFVDPDDPRYPSDAQYAYDERDIGATRPDLPHIQRRVRDVLRYRSPPGLSLDVGCGKGELALALAGRGFEATGIDMKPRLVAHLKERFPQVTWECAMAQDLAQLGRRFDVITLYHVLEHVAQPAALLAAAKGLANPGALIVAEVPNVDGWKARWMGRAWHYYKVDHVGYFRPTHLVELARRAELEVLALRGYQHFSYPQQVAWKDAVKGLLAWLGFRDVVSIFMRVPA